MACPPRTLAPALLFIAVICTVMRLGPEARGATPYVPARTLLPAKITLASAAGKVEVAGAGTEAWKAATSGAELNPEDQVKTGDDGYAMIAYADATLRLLPASLAVLGQASIRVRQGTTWMRMRKSGRTFTIETPSIAVSVVGTLVRAEAGRTGSSAQLVEGLVDVRRLDNRSPQVKLTPGYQAIAPNAGGLTASKIDPATLARLSAEYTNVMKLLPSIGGGKQGGKGGKSGSGGSGGSGDAGDAGSSGMNSLPGFGAGADEGGGADSGGATNGGGATGGATGGGTGGGTTGGAGGSSAPGAGPGSSSGTPAKSGQGSSPAGNSSTPGPRSNLGNLQEMMDTRSTGLVSPSFGGGDELYLPNTGSGTTQVQSQPGGASSRAAPQLLLPPAIPGAVAGPGGGAPPPPPPR